MGAILTKIWECFASKKENLDLSIIDTLNTGDIILFSGDTIISDIVKFATNSKWSHVGIVVKDPDFLINKPGTINGIYLLESDSPSQKDLDSGKYKIGVQISDLKEKIASYDGEVWIRRLNTKLEKEKIHSVIKIVYNTLYNKPYDWYPVNLLDAVLENETKLGDLLDSDPRHIDRVFCSALVGYSYVCLELLENKTEWSFLFPKYFAEINNLLSDSKLEEMIVVKNK